MTSLKQYFVVASCIIACMFGTAAYASETTEREQHVQVVHDFLYSPDIHNAMTNTHGKNVDKLMKKVKKLDDEQLQLLAQDTTNLMQYGSGSGTQHHESKTAENISDKWLQLGYIALAIPVILLLLIAL